MLELFMHEVKARLLTHPESKNKSFFRDLYALILSTKTLVDPEDLHGA